MGDPVCWLDRTCPACGRFLDDAEVSGTRCPRCGAELDQPDDRLPPEA